ncbi:MAG TPA: gamma-glutamyl-gamma-aminobutyrate hydrolase family protein [Terracidiphilus sp.]|nr:gamma-glutamyl-gamma-aminobutyrate hydrolase family protein [Terracidiphilus sp.]
MVRIAIPQPTSSDAEYNRRALPQYLDALQAAGAEPVVLGLSEPREKVAALVAGIDGILLPGSRYDVDPALYGEERIPECGEADPARYAVDALLLETAFRDRRPLLAICHGLQALNVWRRGTLVQDLRTAVNHRPGRDVVEAHPVELAEGSRLARILADAESGAEAHQPKVNSSHHQAVCEAGQGLRVTAVSPADGVVEAVELDAPDHFVLGVQWHPERTYAQSPLSRAIFADFLRAADSRAHSSAGSGRR